MRDFWNERAKEDAFFFVDNRLDYRNPDIQRFWSHGESDLRQLLDMAGVDIQQGDSVVDVGCGLGRLTRAATVFGAGSVHAIDISSEMLDRAKEYNAELENVTWVHGDGTSLGGIPDAIADALVSHVVFQHIPDPQVTLGYVRDMGRVLKPGGWAAFQVSNDPSIHRRARRPSRTVRTPRRPTAEGLGEPGLARFGGGPPSAARSGCGVRHGGRTGQRRGHAVLHRRPAPPIEAAGADGMHRRRLSVGLDRRGLRRLGRRGRS